MKIILCKSQFMGPVSGADETIVTYASQLKQEGHDPTVLLMYAHPTDAQYEAPLRECGVKVSRITDHPAHVLLAVARNTARRLSRVSRRSPQALHRNAERITRRIANRYLSSGRQYFARSGADVVHVLTPDAAAPVLIGASHAAGVPVIYQELGTPYYSLEHGPYYERLIEALPLCAEVAALSPLLAEQCREKYELRNPVSVLPLMIEDLRNGSRARSSASPGEVTFGFAARFDAMKGPLLLVRAFARMCSEFPPPRPRLKIAGSGPQASEIALQAAGLDVAGRCDLPGVYISRQQKTEFFTSLDVLVHPSLAEGTPNSIVEAMSFGLPIIASAVGGVPEVISTDAGILVPPGDDVALAEAMRRLAEDVELRARMGRAARARYEKLFAPDVVLPLMLNTYERVARTNGVAMVAGVAEAAAAAAGAAAASGLHPWTQAEYAK